MEIIAIIVGIVKAIPIIDSWFQQFMKFYVETQIANMKQENIEAIRKALLDHDQRPIEKALGVANPGELSLNPNTRVVDSVAGVHKPKAD